MADATGKANLESGEEKSKKKVMEVQHHQPAREGGSRRTKFGQVLRTLSGAIGHKTMEKVLRGRRAGMRKRTEKTQRCSELLFLQNEMQEYIWKVFFFLRRSKTVQTGPAVFLITFSLKAAFFHSWENGMSHLLKCHLKWGQPMNLAYPGKEG